MLTELCTESLVGVVERRFVIGKSCFKRVLSESNISLDWPVIFSCHEMNFNTMFSSSIKDEIKMSRFLSAPEF